MSTAASDALAIVALLTAARDDGRKEGERGAVQGIATSLGMDPQAATLPLAASRCAELAAMCNGLKGMVGAPDDLPAAVAVRVGELLQQGQQAFIANHQLQGQVHELLARIHHLQLELQRAQQQPATKGVMVAPKQATGTRSRVQVGAPPFSPPAAASDEVASLQRDLLEKRAALEASARDAEALRQDVARLTAELEGAARTRLDDAATAAAAIAAANAQAASAASSHDAIAKRLGRVQQELDGCKRTEAGAAARGREALARQTDELAASKLRCEQLATDMKLARTELGASVSRVAALELELQEAVADAASAQLDLRAMRAMREIGVGEAPTPPKPPSAGKKAERNARRAAAKAQLDASFAEACADLGATELERLRQRLAEAERELGVTKEALAVATAHAELLQGQAFLGAVATKHFDAAAEAGLCVVQSARRLGQIARASFEHMAEFLALASAHLPEDVHAHAAVMLASVYLQVTTHALGCFEAWGAGLAAADREETPHELKQLSIMISTTSWDEAVKARLLKRANCFVAALKVVRDETSGLAIMHHDLLARRELPAPSGDLSLSGTSTFAHVSALVASGKFGSDALRLERRLAALDQPPFTPVAPVAGAGAADAPRRRPQSPREAPPPPLVAKGGGEAAKHLIFRASGPIDADTRDRMFQAAEAAATGKMELWNALAATQLR